MKRLLGLALAFVWVYGSMQDPLPSPPHGCVRLEAIGTAPTDQGDMLFLTDEERDVLVALPLSGGDGSVILDALGQGKVRQVLLDRRDGVWLGAIEVVHDEETTTVDTAADTAVLLAEAERAPIYVRREVLRRYALTPKEGPRDSLGRELMRDRDQQVQGVRY